MTPDTLEQAKAAFLQGLHALENQEWTTAERHFETALALAPGRPSVMHNLGITRAHLGRHAEAEPLLRAALEAEPQQAEGWLALARSQLTLDQLEAAVTSYARCFALGLSSAALQAQQAQCLARLGRLPEAIQAYQRALAQDDKLVAARTALGSLYRESGRYDEAAACFRRALADGDDPELLRYYLAAVTQQDGVLTPPPQYIRQLFDDYAADFDAHLVDQLGYQGHRVLVDRLPAPPDSRFARTLDLGCGTGLCGAHVRARTEHLSGIDIAPAMIVKAQERGVYDFLHAGDLHAWLVTSQEAYDLVLAADVFIYVGDLERVFGLLAQRMRTGAWLAFTVEDAAPGQDIHLLPSLRYAHALDYLRALAERHGFDTVAAYEHTIRCDQQRPVPGRYVYMQRR